MNVTIVGTGYVGLVAGACFADTGNRVICLDIDLDKVDRLRKGIIPIYEPGLEDLVVKNTRENRLSFSTDYREAISSAEIVFLAVGTPSTESGDPDMQYVRNAAIEIGKYLKAGAILVNKSTVPIGTHLRVREWVASQTQVSFEVVSNPEFLKEGAAVGDFLKPDRVVIGTENDAAFQKMADLYEPFCRQGNPIIRMDTVSAEITKYACNAFLATRISFMNELSRLCDRVGGDVEQVRNGMASDVRIGKHFLYAGAGYGGSCFPKDVKALVATGKQYDTRLEIIETVERVNEVQKEILFQKLNKVFLGDLKGKQVGIWGLAFKPNTDDMREAPALTLIRLLVGAGAKVRVYDPVAIENTKAILKSEGLENAIQFSKNVYEVTEGSDAILLVTEWNEFKQLDWKRVRLGMRKAILMDGRNIYNPKKMQEMGFQYYAIGRGQYTVS